MFSLFSGFDRLRSLVSKARDAEKINAAFRKEGYPGVVVLDGIKPPRLNKDYRIDFDAPPSFVWFQLAEVYVQYLPDSVELTYDVRKNTITRIKDIVS
jgi:hypothetical protein